MPRPIHAYRIEPQLHHHPIQIIRFIACEILQHNFIGITFFSIRLLALVDAYEVVCDAIVAAAAGIIFFSSNPYVYCIFYI